MAKGKGVRSAMNPSFGDIYDRYQMCIRDRPVAVQQGRFAGPVAQAIEALIVQAQQGMNPVSYTHLDVYKRQP